MKDISIETVIFSALGVCFLVIACLFVAALPATPSAVVWLVRLLPYMAVIALLTAFILHDRRSASGHGKRRDEDAE